MKKLLSTIGILAVIFGALTLALRVCSEFETRRAEIDSLKPEKISSMEYPWSIKQGLITSVKNYREAYDIDSNDWIAEFLLLPTEAKGLAGQLAPLPSDKPEYRCQSSLANWNLEYDLCNSKEMRSKGFIGYYYNPSLCEAGCKQDIVLWVQEESGRSFIVGTPDYD